MRYRIWSFIAVLALALSLGCQSKKKSVPRSTLGKPKTVVKKAAWHTLFQTKKVSLPAILKGISFGSPRAQVEAISPVLAAGKSWPLPGMKGVELRTVLHADTRKLRSVELSLPGDGGTTLTALWGPGREGQVDGRRPALFWFDKVGRIQAIFERKKHDSRLMLWPYTRLRDVLAPATAKGNDTVAAMVGQTAAAVRAMFPRQMKRRARPGFLAWRPPLKFRTRPLSLRFDETDGKISSASFKLETTGNPAFEGRILDMIRKTWGAPKTAGDGHWEWASDGKSLRIDREQPGRLRPLDPILRVRISVAAQSDSSADAGPKP